MLGDFIHPICLSKAVTEFKLEYDVELSPLHRLIGISNRGTPL